jgi:hypothetical protein
VRIPLSVEKFYEERKLVFASVFVRLSAGHGARGISAAVDSGSPFTAISTRDALAFQLPISSWQKGEMTYLAGFKFYRYILDATLSFKDDQNRIISFKQKVAVLVPTKLNKSSIEEVQNVPSLIGTDFLEDHKLKFIYEPYTMTAYFEKPEDQMNLQPTALLNQPSTPAPTAGQTSESPEDGTNPTG